jgi:AraC-like DNA-binding protein
MLERKYVQTARIQDVLKEHYPERKMNIYDVYSFFETNDTITSFPVFLFRKFWGTSSDDAFESALLDAPCSILNPSLFLKKSKCLEEPAIFDCNRNSNLMIYRYFNYYKDIVHSHSFFEMFYVFRGNCSIESEGKTVALTSGDFIIIAPGTTHLMISDEDNFILNISVRKSDFESIFYPEMCKDNILSLFLRNILHNKLKTGYLLFHTQEDPDLKYIIKNLTMESMSQDDYNFDLGNYWLSILLLTLIRFYYLDMEMEPPLYGNRFSYILQYIEKNYKTATLDDLADHFGYTKPYLCSMIKENTGHTFSYLINLQKVHVAAKLLEQNQATVDEISRSVGYTNADHFSRTFKKYYGISPSEYKKSQI